MPGILSPLIRGQVSNLLNYQPYPTQTPWGTQGISLGDVAKTGLEISPILGDLSAVNQGIQDWNTSPGLSLLNFASAVPGIGSIGDIAHMGLLGGMTAFHGSPHLFDAFDLSKIGTGEGAQAYGHGIYLAENPKVAKSYMMAGRSDKSISNPTLYKVDLPDKHIANMLDWDKPLKDQPKHIQDKIQEMMGISPGLINSQPVPGSWTGKDIYKYAVQQSDGIPEGASSWLDENGIKGIKYIGETSNQRNYVIFDPSIAKITGRE